MYKLWNTNIETILITDNDIDSFKWYAVLDDLCVNPTKKDENLHFNFCYLIFKYILCDVIGAFFSRLPSIVMKNSKC